jgi:hypothetical protein
MLKKKITYTDFNDEEVTEELYFNLTRTELIELEVGKEDGFVEYIQRVIKAKDQAALIDEFKRLILLAYGQKSSDGRRFIKTPELREEFVQTAAYDALFLELATDENAAAEFVVGVLPKELAKDVSETAQVPSQINIPRPPPPVPSI